VGVAPNQGVATNVYYVYTDHLNTPRVITRSPDGKMVWRWDSGDPFGLLPPNDNPSGPGVFTFNLRMPGQYYDKNTNLGIPPPRRTLSIGMMSLSEVLHGT